MSEQNKPNVREELVREVIAHMRGMEPWDGKTFDKELSAKLQRLATLSTPTEAVKLLREIREQDYLSDSMRSRIDELMASALKGKDDA